jgi:hypothetical protein
LATSSVRRQSRIRASADCQSAISRLEVGTANWRYDAGQTRSAGGPNPEIAQVCPGLPGFTRLCPGKVSSVRSAGCGRIPVNRESATTAIYCAKPCVPISNQPIRSHINLMNFLPIPPNFQILTLWTINAAGWQINSQRVRHDELPRCKKEKGPLLADPLRNRTNPTV